MRHELIEALRLFRMTPLRLVDRRFGAFNVTALSLQPGRSDPGVNQVRIGFRGALQHRRGDVGLPGRNADQRLIRQCPSVVRIALQDILRLLGNALEVFAIEIRLRQVVAQREILRILLD